MTRFRILAAVILGIMIIAAALNGVPILAVILAVPFAFAVSRPLVLAAFALPHAARWLKYRDWQGEYVSFDDVHIRIEKSLSATEHASVAIPDVERALGRKLAKLSNEFIAKQGLLAGLRCIAADALYEATQPYERGGFGVDRLRTNQFNRWLKATLLVPVERERERSELAARAIGRGPVESGKIGAASGPAQPQAD